MIKICWLMSIVMLSLSLGSIFTSKSLPNQDLSFLDQKEEVSTQKAVKITQYHYSVIWQTNINTKAPAIRVTTPNKPIKILERIVEQGVQNLKILSDDFATATISGRDRLIEAKSKRNENARLKRWEITLQGHKVSVIKIDPENGVTFQLNDETYLKKATNTRVVRAKKSTENLTAKKLGENRWQMSKQQGKKLIQNYDELVRELAPVEVPQGLKIRRVLPGSDAHNFGLRENDVVSGVNGRRVYSLNEIPRLIRRYKRKKNLKIELIRNSQKVTLSFQVK